MKSTALMQGIEGLRSVEAFQENLSRVFVDMLLQRTAEDVSVSYASGFEGHGALFISNHRDIVWIRRSSTWPSFLEESTTQIGIGSNLLQTEGWRN